MFADWVFATLINRLPARPGDTGKPIIPLVVRLENETLKRLGLDLEESGVDEYGKQGGMFIKIEVDPENITSRQQLNSGDDGIIITSNFSGGESIFDEYYRGMINRNKDMQVLSNSYKVMNVKLLRELSVLSNHEEQLLKSRADLLESAMAQEQNKSNEDEENLEKGGD